MRSRWGGRDPGESLNDWRPIIPPVQRSEAASGLALCLCLASLFALGVLGALTRSSWMAALASALCFAVAIFNAASHALRCLRCGRLLALPLRSSAYLDLIPDPRRCEHCQDRPPPDAC